MTTHTQTHTHARMMASARLLLLQTMCSHMNPTRHSTISSLPADPFRSFRGGVHICKSAAAASAWLDVAVCSVPARTGPGGFRNHGGGGGHLACHDFPVPQRCCGHHGVPLLHICAIIWLAQRSFTKGGTATRKLLVSDSPDCWCLPHMCGLGQLNTTTIAPNRLVQLMTCLKFPAAMSAIRL